MLVATLYEFATENNGTEGNVSPLRGEFADAALVTGSFGRP